MYSINCSKISFNIEYILFIGFFIRIIEIGHENYQISTYIQFCKIRQYFLVSTSIVPFYCQCFATISQFLTTSKHARIRQMNSMKRTYWICFINNSFRIFNLSKCSRINWFTIFTC